MASPHFKALFLYPYIYSVIIYYSALHIKIHFTQRPKHAFFSALIGTKTHFFFSK